MIVTPIRNLQVNKRLHDEIGGPKLLLPNVHIGEVISRTDDLITVKVDGLTYSTNQNDWQVILDLDEDEEI